MSRIRLQSPAKLNLYLKVLDKRSDGFHNIITVFQRINLVDDIMFHSTKLDQIKIICSHPQVPLGSKNLIHKVIKMIKEEFGITKGIEVKIKKRIPVAAGLAGGSSNAATTILGLNQLWNLKLSRSQMVSMASRIGSDVAFFLMDKSFSLGTQRGEKLKNLDIPTKLWQVVVTPKIKLYAGKIYAGLQSSKSRSKIGHLTKFSSSSCNALRRSDGRTNLLTKMNDDVNILLRYLKSNNLEELGCLLSNDLEPEVVRSCPKLLKLKEKLKSLNTKGVMVSGSGPSIFGLTETEKEAKSIQALLSKRFSQVYVVRTL